MRSCKILHLSLAVGILSLFSLPRLVFANEIINDDFSNPIKNYWVINKQQGGIVEIVDNTYLHIGSQSITSFPYIYLSGISIPDDNYSIEVRYRFSGNYNYGSGIIFSDNLLKYDTNELIDVANTIFQVWPDTNKNAWINTSLCKLGCVYPNFSLIKATDFGSWHKLKIESINNIFSAFVDDDLVFVSSSSAKKIRHVWFGNPEKPPSVLWPDVDIDYFKLSTINNDIYPSIVIPGMGASWDFDALLNDTSGSEWKIPDFVKVYDGLVRSFDNTDEYTLNQNLFVFTYDWRKPLDSIADDLSSYINGLPIDRGQKINLVGHSMGGLVARAYAQKYQTDNKINNLYLLGAPNNGTVKAYGAWEGAEVWDNAWWSKAALAIASHIGSQPGETQIDSLRRIVPSIKDMLPTNDFLSFNGQLLPWTNMSQKNAYLNGLNDIFISIDNKVTNILSNDISTKQYISVEPRSFIDEHMEKWEDGKPIQENPFQFAAGDGTVTYDEAKGPFTKNVDGVGGHGDLVTNIENIKTLFRLIGLDETKAIPGSSESIDLGNVLVAILRSPGRLEVCDKTLTKCNEKLGYYFPNYKLFILPGYNQEDLITRVYEEGLGSYSLHLGYITNEANWKIADGQLSNPGQIDFYNIKSQGGDLSLMKDEKGPTTPTVLGFHNPELACGGTTNTHYITVDWSDSEDESGVTGYEYNIDYPNDDKRGQWTTFFNVSQYRGSLNEGIHYIRVRAKDRAGNFSEWSNACSVIADWTAPVVNILSPSQGMYLPSQLPELSYTVNDNLDPNPEITISGFSKEDGDHVISITAKDKADNVGSATVSYTVQAPPSNKNQCKNGGWKLFTLSRFRNQGECVSFVERNPIATNKYFWWI